ncbi:hypothetical protein SHAb15599_00035 [Acinetobacter phage SH-Ab 15599]|nr:hypothetical protein SHAb15599_00035 [Acinetobacter phage SH-Ab 15599]
MDGLLLLRESTDQVEILRENTATGSAMYIEGPFISCNMKNRNGRVYPRSMMEAVVDQYQREYINERRAIGEFIHPEYPYPNPKMAALRIDSLTWQGDLVIGKAKVLEGMEDGKKLKTLIEEGFKLGVSTRGLGKLARDKVTVEQYRMNAVDAVDLPSGQPCYFDVVNESALWYPTETGGWVQRNEDGHIINEADDAAQVAEFNMDSFLKRLDEALHQKIYR